MKTFEELNTGDNIYVYNKTYKIYKIATISNMKKTKNNIKFDLEMDNEDGCLIIEETNKTQISAQNIIFSTSPIQ